MKQVLSIFQCLCTIWLNTVIIMLILQEVHGILKEIKKFDNGGVIYDDNAPSFKYKADLIGNTETHGTKKGVKIALSLNI